MVIFHPILLFRPILLLIFCRFPPYTIIPTYTTIWNVRVAAMFEPEIGKGDTHISNCRKNGDQNKYVAVETLYAMRKRKQLHQLIQDLKIKYH